MTFSVITFRCDSDDIVISLLIDVILIASDYVTTVNIYVYDDVYIRL